MARFYANENFARPAVEKLRAFGHDVLTVLEAGKAEQAIPDNEVLAFACSEEHSSRTRTDTLTGVSWIVGIVNELTVAVNS